LWAFTNNTLADKGNLFKTKDEWNLTSIGDFGDAGTIYIIKNISSKGVVEVQEDTVVESIQEEHIFPINTTHMWEKRIQNNGKYFTLTNLWNKKLLTAISDNQLAITGNHKQD
jgi:hypothetical protein